MNPCGVQPGIDLENFRGGGAVFFCNRVDGFPGLDGVAVIEAIAKKRAYRMKGGDLDL